MNDETVASGCSFVMWTTRRRGGRCSGGGERTEGAKDSVTGLNKNEIVMMTKR